jgi:hypothetical protein
LLALGAFYLVTADAIYSPQYFGSFTGSILSLDQRSEGLDQTCRAA